MRSAQDALDLLGLSPSKSLNEREEEEVSVDLEAQHSDSDQSSPPVSSPEHSDEEQDPILDFMGGTDEYSHNSQPHVSAAMVGGIIRTQQALQGIKSISESMKPKVSHEVPRFSTEASMEVSPYTKSESDIHNTSPLKWVTPSRSNIPIRLDPPSTSSTSSESSSHPLPPPLLIKPKSDTAPPPIPPYNPTIPDQFLLSNRPGYQMQLKRLQHSYEDVVFDDDPPSTAPVVLRNKQTKAETDGPPLPPPCIPETSASSKFVGSLDPLKASRGLPASGELNEL